jgi:hypothetical protein
VAEATIGRGLRSSEEVWLRWTNLGCNMYIYIYIYTYIYTYIYAWKQYKEFPYIAIFISNYKNAMFFLLTFMFFLITFYVLSSTKLENK